MRLGFLKLFQNLCRPRKGCEARVIHLTDGLICLYFPNSVNRSYGPLLMTPPISLETLRRRLETELAKKRVSICLVAASFRGRGSYLLGIFGPFV